MGKVYLFIGAVVIVLAAATALLFVAKKNKTANTTQTATQQAQNQGQTQSPTEEAKTINSIKGDIALNVTEPTNGSVSQVSVINIKGKTAPEAEVFVNDKQTKADSSGAFTVSVALEEGDNYILVAAADDSGGYSEKELTVSYQPAQ